MRAMATILLCSACGGAGNQEPKFVSINGAPVERDITGLQWVDVEFAFTPGESQVLEVEISDPDGDEVLLWFPKAPPGLRFEPENRSGTWDVPEDFSALWWELSIIAQDEAESSAASSIELYFYAVNPVED